MWPHACAKHPNFLEMSVYAKALLFCLIGQYRGTNNGDLDVSLHRMRQEGWRARNTVEKAREELERRGWIVRTRQGWKHTCSLYAVTIWPINECDGKLDEAPTTTPLGFWKDGRNPWMERQMPSRPPPPQIRNPRHVVNNHSQDVTKLGKESSRFRPTLVTT